MRPSRFRGPTWCCANPSCTVVDHVVEFLADPASPPECVICEYPLERIAGITRIKPAPAIAATLHS